MNPLNSEISTLKSADLKTGKRDREKTGSTQKHLVFPLSRLLVFSLLSFAHRAETAQQITAYLWVTNTAQHSNSLTFNSADLRYAVTNVTNNATQWPVTNTAASTATNLLVHLAGFPPLGLTSYGVQRTETNNAVLMIIAPSSSNLTVVPTGKGGSNWAWVRYETNAFATSTNLPIPRITYTNKIAQSNLVSGLVDWLNQPPRSGETINSTAPIFGNFLSASNVQSGANKYMHGGNWGGGLSNAQLAGVQFSSGTMSMTSGVPIYVRVNPNLYFTNDVGETWRFAESYPDSILRSKDLGDLSYLSNTNQFRPAFTIGEPLVLISGWRSTNGAFYGDSNVLTGRLIFSQESSMVAGTNHFFLLSGDLQTGWSFHSQSQGYLPTQVLRWSDLNPGQFGFNGSGTEGEISITNGVRLTNANFYGGVNQGTVVNGSYSGVSSFAGTNITASDITAANSLNATNVALSNIVAQLMKAARVTLDGSNWVSGSLNFESGVYASLANGVATTNEVELPTNTIVLVSGNTTEASIIGLKEPRPFAITVNVSSFNHIWLHESGAETVPSRRLNCPGNANLVLAPNSAAFWIQFNNRWLCIAQSGALTATATNVVLQSVGNTNAANLGLISTNTSGGALQLRTISAGSGVTLAEQGDPPTNIQVSASVPTTNHWLGTNSAPDSTIAVRVTGTNEFAFSATERAGNRVMDVDTNGVIRGSVFGPGFNHGTWLGANVYQLVGWKMVGAGTPWASSGALGTNHNIRFYPFTSGNGGWFDCLNWDTKAVGNSDIGIYESRSWTNIEPYRLVASTGSNTWSSTGLTTHNTNFWLKPGRIYWVACGYYSSSFQIGAPSTITGLQSDAPLALSLSAYATSQIHTWEMVGCFSNSLPAIFPTGFPIVGQSAALMAFPIALKGN